MIKMKKGLMLFGMFLFFCSKKIDAQDTSKALIFTG